MARRYAGSGVGEKPVIPESCYVSKEATLNGDGALIGVGAEVAEGKTFPERVVVFGSPAKAAREVSEDYVERLRLSAAGYVRRCAQYQAGPEELAHSPAGSAALLVLAFYARPLRR